MRALAGIYLVPIMLLLACIGYAPAKAQLSFTNPQVYTTNNGLSQSSVYAIVQSKRGYMWFATGDGICRFDGREWKTYRNNFTYKGKPASNLYNTNLHTDAKGTLWFSNSSGAYYIKPESNAINYFCPNADTGKFFNHIISLLGVQNGNTVWIAGNGYLYNFNTETNKTTAYNYTQYTYNQSPSISASLLTENKIYLGAYNRIIIFDIKTGSFSSINIEGKGIFTPLDMEEFNGNIYMSSTRGVYQIVDNKALKNTSINYQVGRFYKKATNELFITSAENNLVALYNAQSNTVATYKLPAAIEQNTININCYYYDRNNNLWIGTEGSGVIKTDQKNYAFRVINRETNGISSNFIKGLLRYDKDIVLVGTANAGLNIYNRKTGQNKVVLKERNINFIFKDSKQRIWIGADIGVYLADKGLDFQKQKLQALDTLIPGSNFVFCINESPDGTIYFGTTTGLYYYNDGEKTVKYIFGESYNLSFHFIDNNNVIISQYDGTLKRSVINSDRTARQGKALNILARNPRCMLPEGKDIVWMATENGLLKYNTTTNETKIYNEKNGLNNLYLYAVLQGSNNTLWVSSNAGLSVFNKTTETFRNFDVSYNLQSNEFNTGSYYRADDGELFFGGINGLNYFYPDSVTIDTLKPLQAITKIKIYEKEINADSLLGLSNELKLDYTQNSIYLQFASFDFTEPGKNQFAYRLEGQDTGWSNIGNSNFVRFSALAPGAYSFWLKSANRDGTWCTPQKMLVIIISPPFWQTWWFITLIIILVIITVGLVVYGVTRARYRRRMAILEKEKALQKIRLQLSQDIHDDIGGNLSMIALMSDKLKDNPNADRIADLARNAQRGFRELIWSVNPVHDDLANFIYYLRNHANTFFENTAIETAFDIPADIPQITLLPNVRRNLFLTYKEALNNILKHSRATQVSIAIKITNNQILSIAVQDNGKGLSAKNTAGNGLTNFKHRMEAIGGNFQLVNNAPNGLCLIFSAPLT
jgi:signal transduction histidine kinase/ligand-binding sensor domain-containing protein